MKISGSVEVSNRLLPSLNITNKKPERSHLSLGTLPGKESLFILHQTLKNGVGSKYKVNGNVQAIFAKFINDGKATIRFMNPPHDLNIRSDPEKLKSFLKTLKLVLEGKKISQMPLLCGAPTKVTSKPKTKMIINTKQQIPILTGYPRSLEILQINNVELKKIDAAILRLQNLKVLNLSDNSIEWLPTNLDLLPNLRELILAKNRLGVGNDWRWMNCKSLQDKLIHLDLSSNKIKKLPGAINRFKVLRSLSLADNCLNLLPNGLGLLSSLRDLILSQNKIIFLPSSFRLLKLESLDMSANCGALASFCTQFAASPQQSLLDRAATAVLANRLHFDSETIPWTLVEYLDEANYCVCGSPALPSCVVAAVPFDLRKVALSVTFSHNANPLIGITFCSPKCRSNAYLSCKMIYCVDA